MLRFVGSWLSLVALIALVASTPAGAQSKVDPIGTFRTADGLGTEYRDMGAAIAQIETIKRIPFFNMQPQQRVERFSAYGAALKDRDFKGAAKTVGQDFSSGLVKDIGTIFLTDILTRVAKGSDVNQAVSDTLKGMTSKEFLAGNLLGGTLGAAIGSSIPVPILPGLAGQMMGTLPMLAGALLGTKVGINLVNGRSAFEGIRLLEFTTQTIGSTVGIVLGGLLPVPTLGPIVGGAIGGTMGLKLAEWLRNRAATLRGPIAEAGKDQPLAAAAELPAAPAAPSSSDGLAGLAPAELRKVSDGHYRDYLKAAATGNHAAAAASLSSYKRAQDALTAQR
ncbi:MAG: hypothetical protein HY816_04930 [Candidatus Wallbacteria bacterium]|nr:hypothetical protein [Candidatus Wallbacteria bacterium]